MIIYETVQEKEDNIMSRIEINGQGRTERALLKVTLDNPQLAVAAMNALMPSPGHMGERRKANNG